VISEAPIPLTLGCASSHSVEPADIPTTNGSSPAALFGPLRGSRATRSLLEAAVSCICAASRIRSRARQLFIRQQTSVINAIRAHLAEFGIVVA
jgi:hypothetical protein